MNSQPTPDAWIGRVIGGQRYRLEKRIGGGGMGDVFLAMDTRLGQQVVLKLLKGSLVEFKEMRRRFEREVEVCAALQSEYIVKVSDCGVTEEGFPFYVMEYLRGETLKQLLQREKRLSLDRAVSIISQVCKGLQLAHRGITLWREGATVSEHIQVVHRDLKPDNIFLVPTDFGEIVKILDFGIAKIRNESSEQTNLTAAFIGTFRYATPEQLRGDSDIDGRADIYSLGIILYEMLSGVDPFGFNIKGRSHSETSWIYAHTIQPPQLLRSQPGCENIPSELEAVVMRCLQKEPENRFATVEELNQALQAAVRSMFYGTRQGILEQTIAQIPPQLTQDLQEKTIAEPLIIDQKKKLEETITLTPATPTPKQEENIAQIPSITDPPSEIQEEKPVVQPRRNLLPLLASITVAIVGVFSIGGVFAYPFLTSLRTLNELKSIKAKANYEECIVSSEKISRDSRIYEEAQRILNECRFEYAKQLEAECEQQIRQEDCKVTEAIEILKKVPSDSSVYRQAKELLKKLTLF